MDQYYLHGCALIKSIMLYMINIICLPKSLEDDLACLPAGAVWVLVLLGRSLIMDKTMVEISYVAYVVRS